MAEDLKKMYRTIMDDQFPPKMEISFIDDNRRQTLFYEKVTWTIDGVQKGLRYGENPGQEAALYRMVNGNLVLGETQIIQPGQYLAYLKANMADRVAAFGGCIALNRSVDKATAEAIVQQYAEVVVAPDFEPGVLDVFATKKNLRVIKIGNIERLQSFVGQRCVEFKSLIDGGIVAQWSFVPASRSREGLKLAETEYKGQVYKINRPPSDAEYADMLFGWLVESGITSNSVIYVKDLVTVGIGTGEQDRVGVAEIARDKAYRKLADRYCFESLGIPYNELTDADQKAEFDNRVAAEKGGLVGSAMVSDAFFPFRDGVDVGIREGITAVIQPGGSGNDYQSIEACNEADVTMVYTGQRSFKH